MKRVFFSSFFVIGTAACSVETTDAPPAEPVETASAPAYYGAPVYGGGGYTRACVPNGAACGALVAWTSWTGVSTHPACGGHVNNCGETESCGSCAQGTCQTTGAFAGYCAY